MSNVPCYKVYSHVVVVGWHVHNNFESYAFVAEPAVLRAGKRVV